MLLLAADTSRSPGSIALAQGEPDGSCKVLEVSPLEGGTFSAQLIPQIAALLSRHGYSKHDIGGFAVASGPGSFTGLRVGLAGIKALAEVSGKPIAAVSVLAASASLSTLTGRIVVALDAGRHQLYVAEYENGKAASAESVAAQDDFNPTLVVITPDSSVAELCRAKQVEVEQIARPESAVIARLGWKKILSGDTVTAEGLDANYVRRTDAEILLKH